MKGSTHSIYLAIGCAAMLAGASACSHPTREPSSPSRGASPGKTPIQEQSQTSTGGSNTLQPGFDSERDSQGAGQQYGSQQGQYGAQQGQYGAQQPGGATSPEEQGAQQQGAQPQGAQPQGAQPQGAGQLGAQGSQTGGVGSSGGQNEAGGPSLSEREACDLLTSEAMLRMEPIEGGVAIVAKPRRSSDMSTVRNRVQMIHRGIERGSAGSPAAQCELFALGRNGAAAVIETPDSIRLLVTTTDAARVPALRRQANEYMRSKGAPGSRGGPQGGGTQPGGGTPQHSGEKPQGETP